MFAGMTYVYLIGILLLARITLQASSPSSKYYVGAVVEYFPVRIKDNATATASENAKNYITFLKTARVNDVDIIVFPEASLMAGEISKSADDRSLYISSSSFIPDPKSAKVPCLDVSTNVNGVVKDISCAAKSFSMYVVVNLHEKEKCTGDKCPKDGHMLYNTNVAFDRNGAVVGRYRKFNLFGEPGFDRTTKPELSYFRTDFDVTFGQFICFDILFDSPAQSLVRDKNITDILFSTYWFSELPYLTANEVQNAYSYIHDVNFLGSGYNSPATGSGGSGIYAGKNGILGRIFSEKRINAMIVANISKVDGGRVPSTNPTNAKIIVFDSKQIPTINGSEPVPQMSFDGDNLKPYTTQLFKPTNNTHNMTLCDRGFCCHFQIQAEHREDLVKDAAKYYRYRLAVFNGVRSFGVGGTGGIEVCSIISCIDDNPTSCSQRFDTNTIIVHPTTFNSIVISSDYKISRNTSRFPLSLTTEMSQLNVSDFTFITHNLNATHVNIKYTLTKPHKDLMTFAIYGRNFTADGQPMTTSSSTQLSPFYFILITFIIFGISKAYGVVLI